MKWSWCGWLGSRLAVVTGRGRAYVGRGAGMWSVLKEFWAFARREKKWWLIPLVVVLLMLGAVLIFTSSGGIVWALYPFM